MDNNKVHVNFHLLLALTLVMATIVGTTIPLYLHTNNRTNYYANQTESSLTAIQQEMKDFHGRLCEIESRKNK